MIQLEKKERNCLYPLFEGMHDTIILSCLQGHMGQAYVDQYPNPQCAKLFVSDFCFPHKMQTSQLLDFYNN